MPFYGIHSFRHFAASSLISAGFDVTTVSGALGHYNSGTTLNVYSHMFQNAQVVGKTMVGVGKLMQLVSNLPTIIAGAKAAFTSFGAAISGISAPVVAVIAVVAALVAASGTAAMKKFIFRILLHRRKCRPRRQLMKIQIRGMRSLRMSSVACWTTCRG